MEAKVERTFLVAVLALATAIPSMRISAAPNPEVKYGVDRLYVIDCGDGSGPDESRWTPGANVGTPVDFPGHCYLIHHTQAWFLWDTGIDDAVAQLPNHERVFHEWGPGTGPIWRKPITLAAQLEGIHVKPSDIKLMAVSHSHPDHAGNIEMFPYTLMLVQRVEYEWAGSRQDTVAFSKKHPVKLIPTMTPSERDTNRRWLASWPRGQGGYVAKSTSLQNQSRNHRRSTNEYDQSA